MRHFKSDKQTNFLLQLGYLKAKIAAIVVQLTFIVGTFALINLLAE